MGRKKVRRRRRSVRRGVSPALILILVLLLVVVVIEGFIIIRDRKDSASDDPNGEDKFEIDGEITYSTPYQEEHLVYDPTGLNYIDNELVVQYNRDVTEEEAKALAKDYNRSKLVGFISVTDTAQWRLKGSYSKEQLMTLASQIQQDPSVDRVDLNYMVETQAGGSITKESQKWGNDDYRWAYDDIFAESYYKYKDQMKDHTNVGILDMGFLEDDDLDYEVINGFSAHAYNENSKHGTGIAGILSAISNNKKGIAGVYPTSDATGSVYAFRIANKSSVQQMDYLARLLLKNCRVINVSLGFEHGIAYSIQKNYENQGEDGNLVIPFRMLTDLWGQYLRRWIDHGYEFLIVNAAGNDSRHTSGEGADQGPTYYLNKPIVTSSDDLIIYTEGKKTKSNENDRYVVDTQFSYIFPMIRDEKVKERILCVSAYGRDHHTAAFSNMGERTDIFAPGTYITTLTGNGNIQLDHIISDIGQVSGTSASAPYVSAAAACVWAMDQSLTASEVRSILLQEIDGHTANRTITDQDTGITRPKLNLSKSLRFTSEYLKHREKPVPKKEEHAITVIVRNRKNGEDIRNAWISITDESGQELYTLENIHSLMDSEDKDKRIDYVNFILPEGNYTVEIGANGYERETFTNVQVPNTKSVLDTIAARLGLSTHTYWEFSLLPVESVVTKPEVIEVEDDPAEETVPEEVPEEAVPEETVPVEEEQKNPVSDLPGTYVGNVGGSTYYTLDIHNVMGNNLSLDVRWESMRVFAESDRVTTAVNDNRLSFTAAVVGGHGIAGNFSFDVRFSEDGKKASMTVKDPYGSSTSVELTKQ